MPTLFLEKESRYNLQTPWSFFILSGIYIIIEVLMFGYVIKLGKSLRISLDIVRHIHFVIIYLLTMNSGSFSCKFFLIPVEWVVRHVEGVEGEVYHALKS